jgi:hypothetical protein
MVRMIRKSCHWRWRYWLVPGAVVLYYEVVDSDTVLPPPGVESVVQVVTPEQVTAARAIDRHEAERAAGAAVAFGGAARTVTGVQTSSLAGVPARIESMGRIPVAKNNVDL